MNKYINKDTTWLFHINLIGYSFLSLLVGIYFIYIGCTIYWWIDIVILFSNQRWVVIHLWILIY